jgi:hypothetical protein
MACALATLSVVSADQFPHLIQLPLKTESIENIPGDFGKVDYSAHNGIFIKAFIINSIRLGVAPKHLVAAGVQYPQVDWIRSGV